MNDLFSSKEYSDNLSKINLEELYEKKKNQDLAKLNIYNRILNRIHEKIKLTARQKNNEQFTWFVIPEVMIGIGNYDRTACITYILEKLDENGFIVRYTHPNLIFISWKHYVPQYVRNEFKKKTGMKIDEYGNKVQEEEGIGEDWRGEIKVGPQNNVDPFGISKKNNNNKNNENKKEFKPINTYKPTGNLIYNNDLFKKIEDKFS